MPDYSNNNTNTNTNKEAQKPLQKVFDLFGYVVDNKGINTYNEVTFDNTLLYLSAGIIGMIVLGSIIYLIVKKLIT